MDISINATRKGKTNQPKGRPNRNNRWKSPYQWKKNFYYPKDSWRLLDYFPQGGSAP